MSINKKNSDGSYSQFAGMPYVTKDNLGIEKVENKSSEDIRGEITSKNIKDALGYTPANDVDEKKSQNDIAVLSSRMDGFTKLGEGSTTGDAELEDIRVAYDGKTYSNAGTAVRSQVTELKETIDTNVSDLKNDIKNMAGLETITIVEKTNAVIDVNLNINIAGSWRISNPIQVKKGFTYHYTCTSEAGKCAVAKSDSLGNLIEMIQAGDSTGDYTFDINFDGYIVLCWKVTTSPKITQYYNSVKNISEIKHDIETFQTETTFNINKSKLAGLTPNYSENASLFDNYWNNKQVCLIHGAAIKNVDLIKKISLHNLGVTAYGFGYFDDSNEFVITKYEQVNSNALQVNTYDVNVILDRTKEYHYFAFVMSGAYQFGSTHSGGYYKFDASGSELIGSHDVTFVEGNDANFISIDECYTFTDKNFALQESSSDYITHVGKNGAYDFSEIQDAVNALKEIAKTIPCIIYVHAGEYQPFKITNGSMLSIIGDDRQLVTVKSTAGIRATPAADIAVHGLIKNISFIATHDDISTLPDGDFGSYAVHSDFYMTASDIPLVFDSCDFTSYQTAAFGCGLWGGEKLILRNCNFYSYYEKSFNPSQAGDYSSLLVHTLVDSAINDEEIIVENCMGYTKECSKAVMIYRYNANTNFKMTIRNSSFYSETGGFTAQITDGTLQPNSYGNNINKLNYNEI